MLYYRRHLPHWIPDEAAIFVTWRLAGPGPFEAGTGPFWLQHPRVAGVVADALLYGEMVRKFYQLHAWAIMPNHVHVVFQPHAPMPAIMRWLKGRTGRVANRILGRTGKSFWQDESFDHWIRSAEELEDLIAYVENNPVKAGLAELGSSGNGQVREGDSRVTTSDRRLKTIVCPTLSHSFTGSLQKEMVPSDLISSLAHHRHARY